MTNSKQGGFTLVELMTTVVIMAVLAAIAFPTYKVYVGRAATGQAEAEMQKVAALLAQYKGRNFTYSAFDLTNYYDATTAATSNTLNLPLGATLPAKIQYSIKLDTTTAAGKWNMVATPNKAFYGLEKANYLLLTDTGLACQAATAPVITASSSDCGVAGKPW